MFTEYDKYLNTESKISTGLILSVKIKVFATNLILKISSSLTKLHRSSSSEMYFEEIIHAYKILATELFIMCVCVKSLQSDFLGSYGL